MTTTCRATYICRRIASRVRPRTAGATARSPPPCAPPGGWQGRCRTRDAATGTATAPRGDADPARAGPSRPYPTTPHRRGCPPGELPV